LTTPDSQERGQDILERLRLRDARALASLAELYGSDLTRACYLYLADAHAAEDVCQETLLAAWNAAGRTNGRTPLRAWLFGILFNQCRKHRRSLWRRERRELDAAQRRAESAEGHEDAERLETLRHAVARLDEALRAVVILRYEQGFSIAETAETLGLPEGTVKSRTSAAIERLRTLMRIPE